ncbi:unnamed protein product, partial [Didymodactylos carnosus]
STTTAVEKQTEAAREKGTVWNAIRKANQKKLEKLLNKDQNIVNERGFVGECPLHMLFLYGTPEHLELAKYIIRRFPGAITAIYNLSEYYGENVLHVAIIKKNAEMVEWLLGDPNNYAYRDQLLNGTATGSESPRYLITSSGISDRNSIGREKPVRGSGKPCYYGEYPLAFACCTNQWNLVEILIKYGANLDMIDSKGNTILHLMVIHNLPDLYVAFKQRWIEEFNRKKPKTPSAHLRKINPIVHRDSTSSSEEESEDDEKVEPFNDERNPPLWKRLNKENLTPLTLAAKLGKSEMFSFLIEERKIVQWTFGPVSCILYPLDQLDLELQSENTEPVVSGLELIVKYAHVDLIMHQRVIDLVDRKWDRFARKIFFKRFMTTLSYLIIFLLTVTEGEGDDRVVTSVEYPQGNYIYYLSRIGNFVVLLGALRKGRDELNEMVKVGITKYMSAS